MAQKEASLPEGIFLKCLSLTLDYYQNNQTQQSTSELCNQKIFNHCFIANLALVFAARPSVIKHSNQKLYEKVVQLLFHKKWASLLYTSPSTLHQLYASLKSNTELGHKIQE